MKGTLLKNRWDRCNYSVNQIISNCMSTNYLTYLDRSRLLGTFGFEDQQGWQITLPQNSPYEAPKGWIQVLYLECFILFNLGGGNAFDILCHYHNCKSMAFIEVASFTNTSVNSWRKIKI